jgi:peroxiredoxin
VARATGGGDAARLGDNWLMSFTSGTIPPRDDGAYSHLQGATVPEISLPTTTGTVIDVCDSLREFTVLFLYPMTGRPGHPLPDGWMEIPGAFGCTAQSCAYRDLVAEFEELDAAVRGVSTQASEEQAEFAQREHIPYPLLSDARLTLTTAMRLPTFVAGGKPRIKRASLVIDGDRSVRRVMYPVRDPADNASATLRTLQELMGRDK